MNSQTFIETLMAKYEKHPSHVRDFLGQLIDLPKLFEDKRIISVILHGSTARGEFSCAKMDSNIFPLSDIEFLIVVQKRDLELEHEISNRILSLKKKLYAPKNPFFHMDFAFISLSKFRRNPKTLRSFELQETGINVCGQNIIKKAPKVTLKNIDLGDLNEIILVRLWNILLYLPLAFLNENIQIKQSLFFSYMLYRNALEIPTILLPNMGILLAGFKKRVNYIESISAPHIIFEFFSKDFAEFMKAALKCKFNPKPYQNNQLLYEKTLSSYSDLLRFISNDRSILKRSELCQQINCRNLKLQNNKHLKRNVHEVFVIASKIKSDQIKWGLRWILQNHRKKVLCYLFHMHLSAILFLKKREKALVHLEQAKSHMQNFYWNEDFEKKSNHSFTDQWQLLRFQFADFISHYFRFYLGKEKYFEWILKEQSK
jgi:predicted nucleotidyltransferase